MTLIQKLTGTKILEEVVSPINGKLTVVKDFAWGIHIMAGGLTQSGGIAATIWQTTLKHLKRKQVVNNSLILGLGGGSIAKLIRKNWQNAVITGVDIDRTIVELGRKYMKLDSYGVDIIIDDTQSFIKNLKPNYKKYDLICIDMYIGDNFPKKFTKKAFLSSVKKMLTPNGVAVFNRLYYGDKRREAVRFGADLEKIFEDVYVLAPQANILFLCKG